MNFALRQRIEFALWWRVHALPRFFVEYWQLRELRRLATLAYRHTAFHRALWDAAGIRPSDIRTLADIRKLPVVSKKLLKQVPIKELMHDSFPPAFIGWTETSGSTGEPFRFPVVRMSDYGTLSMRNIFLAYRFLWWNGATHAVMGSLKSARIGSRRDSSDRRLIIRYESFRTEPREAVLRLREFGPDIVESRPTILVELARAVRALPAHERPRFSYVVSFGETLHSAARRFIERGLGGEVYDLYGTEEASGIGMECRAHDGFHINEESVIVEILDAEGAALEPGLDGRVVVTPFRHNNVMPFIRYDTGDRGMIVPEACSCGLLARRLVVRGREGAFIALGAMPFHYNELGFVIEKFSDVIMSYQLAKIGPADLEVRVVPTRSFSAADANALAIKLNEKIKPHGRASVVLVETLACADQEKTPFFVDETAR